MTEIDIMSYGIKKKYEKTPWIKIWNHLKIKKPGKKIQVFIIEIIYKLMTHFKNTQVTWFIFIKR